MRKSLLFLCLVTLLGNAMAQQSSQRAGIHTGYGFNSYFFEGSYQYDLNSNLRIEGNAGYAYFYDLTKTPALQEGCFDLGGSLQWTGNIVENLHWYAGPALMMFLGSKFDIGIGAQGGAEYRFKFPLRVGLEFRPLINANPLCNKYFDMPIFATAKWCF